MPPTAATPYDMHELSGRSPTRATSSSSMPAHAANIITGFCRIEECLGAGAVGMGEFNADAQGFVTNSAEMAPIAEALINAKRPLLIHCSEPLGHAYPGKGTATPDRIMALVAAFPELTFVGAHWGAACRFSN